MYSKLLLTIAAVFVSAGCVGASPLRERQSVSTPPDRYYLQTKVVGDNHDSGSNKDGLWIYSSHTGAGLGDTGLSSNKSVAWEGYLNGTQQVFTYPNAPAPWPLAVQYGTYQGWFVTTISVSEQPSANDPGFFFNSTGLQYNSTSSGGWLACDWWHGAPQLFSLASYQYGPVPTSCSKVELYPVAV